MIFYFSGTGNSKYVAEYLKKDNEELYSIDKLIRENTTSFNAAYGESVGFVFPVYFYTVPHIVKKFIKRLEIENASYKYVVLVCGGSTGATGKQFNEMTPRINIDGFFSVKMVDNYVIMFKLDSVEKQKNKLIEADKALELIKEKIDKKEVGDFDKLKGICPSLTSHVAKIMYEHTRTTKQFYTDDKCNGCTKCAKECTEQVIVMKENKPTWVKDKCSLCLRCYHCCPLNSIQYGKKTINKGRFYNNGTIHKN